MVLCHDEPIPPSINEEVVKVAGGVSFGVLKGRVEVSDDFDAPLPDDVLAAFEGPSRIGSASAPTGP